MRVKQNRPRLADGCERSGETQQQQTTTTNTTYSKYNILLDAALAYAAQGIPVFPLAPGMKVPAISKDEGGRGFHDATTDTERIRRWWKRWPRANIGIPTGSASGWVVIDIDPRHGGDRSLAAL